MGHLREKVVGAFLFREKFGMSTNIGKRQMGGKTYHAAFVRISMGGTCDRAHPPKPVLEGSESGIGLVCARSRV